jgi:hypothetical protein
MWSRILIAGLVGGILIFLTGYVSHGILQLQSRSFANIPDSQAFMDDVNARSLKPGFYIFPDMPTGADRDDPARMAKESERFKTGPAGLLLVARTGMEGMLEMLGKELATNFLAALLAAWIVSLMGVDIGFGRRWLAVLAMGAMAWFSISASYGIWYRFPHDFVHDEALCALLEWGVAGLAIAGIVRRPPPQLSRSVKDENVRQVSPHLLWIGHVIDVADLSMIHAVGIEALVDLGINEPVSRITRELLYCRFPLIDGAGNRPEVLRLAVRVAADLVVAGIPTLVFCSAGMSRSPAVASAALALATGKQPNECLAEVFAGAPGDLSRGLWHDLLGIVAERPPCSGEIV